MNNAPRRQSRRSVRNDRRTNSNLRMIEIDDESIWLESGPLPSNISETKWQKIQQEEYTDHVVNFALELIVQTAVDIIYKKYLEETSYKFVVHCSHQALQQLFNWMYLNYDPGETSATIAEFWSGDKEQETLPKDAWACRCVPLQRKEPSPPGSSDQHKICQEKCSDEVILEFPVVENIELPSSEPAETPSFIEHITARSVSIRTDSVALANYSGSSEERLGAQEIRRAKLLPFIQANSATCGTKDAENDVTAVAVSGSSTTASPGFVKVHSFDLAHCLELLDEESQIVEVDGIELPPFWEANPALWFIQVEAQFSLFGIYSDDMKYHIIVVNLDREILQQVSALIKSPPERDKYLALKKELMTCFTDSDEKQLRKLFTEIELGDKRPSELLREMNTLATGKVDKKILRILWVQRMPPNIQALLAIQEEDDLFKLANMADKIHDVRRPTTSFPSMEQSTSSLSTLDINSRILALEQQMDALTKAMSNINTPDRERQGRSRSRSRSYARNCNNQQQNICYFHQKFGSSARNCRWPCSFKVESSPRKRSTGDDFDIFENKMASQSSINEAEELSTFSRTMMMPKEELPMPRWSLKQPTRSNIYRRKNSRWPMEVTAPLNISNFEHLVPERIGSCEDTRCLSGRA